MLLQKNCIPEKLMEEVKKLKGKVQTKEIKRMIGRKRSEKEKRKM